MENAEDKVLITIDDRAFKSSELTEEQRTIATELNVIARQIEETVALYNKLNRDKNYRISDFQNSLNVEEVEAEETQEEK